MTDPKPTHARKPKAPKGESTSRSGLSSPTGDIPPDTGLINDDAIEAMVDRQLAAIAERQRALHEKFQSSRPPSHLDRHRGPSESQPNLFDTISELSHLLNLVPTRSAPTHAPTAPTSPTETTESTPSDPIQLVHALLKALLLRLGFDASDVALAKHFVQVVEEIIKVRQQRQTGVSELLRLVNARSTATTEGTTRLALNLGATQERIDACLHEYVLERVAADTRVTNALLALTKT